MLIKQEDQYPQLNLLRGIAALMVVVFHFCQFVAPHNAELFPGDSLIKKAGLYGNMGVFMFFVISGFVIPYSLYKNNYQIRDIFRFLLKRSVRIEPPYIASILLTILVGFWLAHHWGYAYVFEPKRFLLHLFYLIPFTKVEWYNVIYWTLAIEFQYYLAMALLFPLLMSKNKWIRYGVISLWLSVSAFGKDLYFIPMHTAVFFPGIALFLLVTSTFDLKEFIFWTVVSFVLVGCFLPASILITILVTVLMIMFIRWDTAIGNNLGKISYSLYLTHGIAGGLFLMFTINTTMSTFQRYGLFFLAIGIAVTFAWIFYLIIERRSKLMSGKLSMKKM